MIFPSRKRKLSWSRVMPSFQVENKIKTYLKPPEPLRHVCAKNLAVEGNLPFETKMLFLMEFVLWVKPRVA